MCIVVERKLAERKDSVDEKDRSTSWKIGIFFYSVALTLVYSANVYFFALVKDDSEYQLQIEFSKGEISWRNSFLWIAHLLPLCGLTIDFCLNSIVLSHKHTVVNLIFTFAYFFFTYIG